LPQALEGPRGTGTRYDFAAQQLFGCPGAGLQRTQGAPVRTGRGRSDALTGIAHAQPVQAEPQRIQEARLARPRRKVCRRGWHLVYVQIAQEISLAHPAPAAARVHDLDPRPHHAPHHHEVGQARRQPDHDQGRQRIGFAQEHVLHRQQHLAGFQTQSSSQILERIDGRPVDRGVTSLTQPTVVGANAETFQQRFQGCGAAVHGRGLHHLVGEELPPLPRALRLTLGVVL